MSKHGQKMSDRFQRAETARREKLGKPIEVPKKEETETPEPRFNISGGARA
jgi:hypothetical protein